MQAFIDAILMKRFNQCRSLEFHTTKELSSTAALKEFVNLPPGSLRALESLVLEGFDEADFVAGRNPGITAFRESPNLQKVTTDNLNFTYSIDHVDGDSDSPKFDCSVLPWIQLTHLMITNFLNVHIFVAALSQCSALQYLRVSLLLTDRENQTNAPDHPLTTAVSLSSLTEMYISIHEGTCIPKVMDIFSFPALTHLCFRRSEISLLISSEENNMDSFSWAASEHFLSQLCHLQRLTLVGHVGSSDEVQILLRSVQAMVKLTLDIWVNYLSLIPVMFPSDNRPTIPRQLAELELHLQRTEIPFPSHVIYEYLSSTPPHLLRYLKIASQIGHRKFIKNLCAQFSSLSYLNTDFLSATVRRKKLTGGWSISARHDLDEALINHRESSTMYSMLDMRY